MSIIKENALKDNLYCPYCLRCSGLVRMKKVEHLYWKCVCGASHDERPINYKKGGPEVKDAFIDWRDSTFTLGNKSVISFVAGYNAAKAKMANSGIRIEDTAFFEKIEPEPDVVSVSGNKQTEKSE